MQNFSDLCLHPQILKNLEDKGYTTPTPIQEKSIPILLRGEDLFGIAQTGTGKTAAFSLPIIHYLANNPKRLDALCPRVLILAPTRELGSQIKDNIFEYSKKLGISSAVIFGGVGQANQVNALRAGLDILVATPGRLMDLMNQGHIRLNQIEVFVLDEADRMLDMGFINDIKKIIAKIPAKRQTLLFSATMPAPILKLAKELLTNAQKVEVTPQATTVEKIDQKVVFCQKADKFILLQKYLKLDSLELCLVFTRTKHGANKIVDHLAKFGVQSAAIHGNKSQTAREKALSDFKAGKIKVLIATDIAARGIDVDGVTHVINFDLPVEAESYVHRIGRTARAGREGSAISFCDDSEKDALKRIEKTIKIILPKEDFAASADEKRATQAIIPVVKKPLNNNQRNNKPQGPGAKPSAPTKVGYRFRNKK